MHNSGGEIRHWRRLLATDHNSPTVAVESLRVRNKTQVKHFFERMESVSKKDVSLAVTLASPEFGEIAGAPSRLLYRTLRNFI